ncbi:hypothetical protein BO70DRAFT_353227 [Aspergillus heteromorphus CBS 117.55]|uniref:Uncharacterized protein n=1 Tax=Aspergillus heteromorphus CBS 117.55 TaxID=1448321 RepID=A0A317W218_9EURO|nr:uncharacterized protein BO70DRAFT_353227 [Aspergillus heteromorphus CBS 117.55]PWY80676.1 hypothetical protein BO70DRAFT_353227 [Aspergillus heteromorphus CBS 117.55]
MIYFKNVLLLFAMFGLFILNGLAESITLPADIASVDTAVSDAVARIVTAAAPVITANDNVKNFDDFDDVDGMGDIGYIDIDNIDDIDNGVSNTMTDVEAELNASFTQPSRFPS